MAKQKDHEYTPQFLQLFEENTGLYFANNQWKVLTFWFCLLMKMGRSTLLLFLFSLGYTL